MRGGRGSSEARVWFSRAVRDADTEFANPDVQSSYTYTRAFARTGRARDADTEFANPDVQSSYTYTRESAFVQKNRGDQRSASARVWFSHAVRDADTEFANPDVQSSYTCTRAFARTGRARDADAEFANPDVESSYTYTRASAFVQKNTGDQRSA